MTKQIFQVSDDETLTPVTSTPYASEDVLQGLLERYPDLLAGDQIDPEDPRRWILVKREAGIVHAERCGQRWRLDHLFLDQDGIPTLVETKIAANPELRRKVAGQMLDYAANLLTSWSLERLQSEFDSRCAEMGKTSSDSITELLGPGSPEEGSGVEDFWRDVQANLDAGRMRLVFVADRIPTSLVRIVEFLNGQMDPCEVLAVELRQYLHGEGNAQTRTLVPHVHGLTATVRRRKKAKRRAEDPGIYILEPIAEEFEESFGMLPRRRMHRRGWIRFDHPEGDGHEEWLIYQSKRDGTINVYLDGGKQPLSEGDATRLLTLLESKSIPGDTTSVSGHDSNGVPFVKVVIPGFVHDDPARWGELQESLKNAMSIMLEAVREARVLV